jgi:hypothetical protein
MNLVLSVLSLETLFFTHNTNIKLTLDYTPRCTDCAHTLKYECNHCLGDQNAIVEENWVPTGVQTITTEQYRDGDKLVTKQRILEEYETGVEAYYKNPGIRDCHMNEAFENEEIRSVRCLQSHTAHEDHLRVKL